MKKHIQLLQALLLALLFLSSFPGQAKQSRYALVIGNGDYQKQSLKNPLNDAKDVAKTLRGLGFTVDLKLNASQQQMESAVNSFGKQLKGDSVGLFYYSGHGVQYEGSNYLIPVGAMNNVFAPDHLRYKTVDAGYVLGVMKQAGNGLNIVILDACRDSPFKSFSRSMNRGLKRVSGVEGTIIAYSTSPGKVALDGDGRNSPYTKQLIKLMKTPDLPVEIMFKNVRKGVKSDTGGKQSPWYESSIDGDFYFNDKGHQIARYEPTQSPLAASSPGHTAVHTNRNELSIYFIKGSWTDIRDASGKKLIYRTVKKGEKIVLSGKIPMTLFFGYAQGVQVRFNGVEIDVSAHTRGVFARFSVGE